MVYDVGYIRVGSGAAIRDKANHLPYFFVEFRRIPKVQFEIKLFAVACKILRELSGTFLKRLRDFTWCAMCVFGSETDPGDPTVRGFKIDLADGGGDNCVIQHFKNGLG